MNFFQNMLDRAKTMGKNAILIAVAAVAIIITAGLIYANSGSEFSLSGIFGESPQKIGAQVVKYINDNQLAQTPATLVKVSEESGLVKVTIKIGTQQFDSYATKDGKLLFPQAITMAPAKNGGSQSSSNSSQAEVSKTDSPKLEAYVVSRCPYGLQMQRAIAEAIKGIPSLAQYVTVKYMGSVSSDGKSITAMHGDAEAKENLRQICIRDEQANKYWSYVSCQMKTGDTAGCEKSTGVDSGKLASCISDPKKGVAYAKKDFDLNTKYNITGSPTLILNTTQIDETGYGGRSADGVKSMVCAAFKNKASFCNTKLSTTAAASSFSETYESSGNSGNNDASCE